MLLNSQAHIIKDVGSGLNDNRSGFVKLTDLIIKQKVNKLVIEHKDRLTRFQFKFIKKMFESYGCEVIGTTSHLSNRPLLREDMKKYMDKADVMLSELKAAAVDVATKDAIAAGLEVVYCDNIPVAINDTYPDLSESVLKLVDSAIDDFNKSS